MLSSLITGHPGQLARGTLAGLPGAHAGTHMGAGPGVGVAPAGQLVGGQFNQPPGAGVPL